MSYVVLGASDPFALFESKLTELRQGKAEEAAGTKAPSPLSTIPGYCWDQPGFKDCHAIAFRAAQADCQAEGRQAEGNKCVGPRADHYATACPCKEPSTAETAAASLASAVTGPTWLLLAVGAVGAWALFGGKKKVST